MPIAIAPYTTTRVINPATQNILEQRHAVATLMDEVQKGLFDRNQWTVENVTIERSVDGALVSFGEAIDLAGTTVLDSVGTVYTQRSYSIVGDVEDLDFDADDASGEGFMYIFNPLATFLRQQGKANIVPSPVYYELAGSPSDPYRLEGAPSTAYVLEGV